MLIEKRYGINAGGLCGMRKIDSFNMKRVLTLLLVHALLQTMTFAQRVFASHVIFSGDCSSMMIDGKKGWKLHDASVVSFFSYNDKELDWTLSICKKGDKQGDGYELCTVRRIIGAKTFKIAVSPDLFEWNDAARFVEKDTCIYIKGMLSATDKDGHTETLPLRFDVLPTKPNFSGKWIHIDFDWDNVDFNESSLFQLTFSAARCKSFVLQCSPSYIEDSSVAFSRGYVKILHDCDAYNFVEDKDVGYSTWGTFFVLQACNSYGKVVADDTISTTDCLEDERMKARISEFMQVMASINGPQESLFGISLKGRILHVDATKDNIDSIEIYDLTGKNVYVSAFLSTIELYNFPKGIYIVVCRKKGRIVQCQKIQL